MSVVSHSVKMPPGPKRRPTQADVARRAGVSTATVSHVVSGRSDRKGGGNAETRQRVEQAMEELGYRPNWAGRALRRQRTGLVGALVSAPSNPWRESLVALAQTELARHDLDLVVFPDARPGTGLDRVMDLLDRRAVDACFTVHLEDDDHPSDLGKRPIPALAFAESGFEGVPKVRHGYARAAERCASQLASRGVRRFVIVRERGDSSAASDPLFTTPILQALDRESPEAEILLSDVDHLIGGELPDVPWGRLETATPSDPVALLCKSDRIAIQAVQEAARRGIAVGESVGIVGRGDLEESAKRGVSTLGALGADYSEAFAALAEAAKTGQPIAQEWTFPWSFIERETTRALKKPAG